MNARTLVVVGAAVAFGAPAVAIAKTAPIDQPIKTVAKHVAKRHVAPRALCICVTIPYLASTGDAEREARIDADLIVQGLEPIYALTAANAALQSKYDADQIALGLNPVFGTSTTAGNGAG